MIVFGLFSLFVVPVLAILAVVRTSRLTREIKALREETAALRAGLAPSAPPRSEMPGAAAPIPEAAAPAPSAEPRVEASTARFHAHQVTQRPTFILENGIGDKVVLSGLWVAAPLAAAIEAMLADAAAYAAHRVHHGTPPEG